MREDDASSDPRRELWRRGSYEIVGDWIAPASLSVLDAVERATDSTLSGRRLLDVATGTGNVAIEAARRGAHVTGLDLTDELLDVARRRAVDVDADVRFVAGDFDLLDDVVGDEDFDVVTSAFGVIFAPDAGATLTGLGRRLAPDGVVGVAAWDPGGALMVPDSMLELFDEPPRTIDMGSWSTGIRALCERASFQLLSSTVDELVVPFPSVEAAADQLERWSGGWAQLLELLDRLGVGREARTRLVDHLAAHSTAVDDGIGVRARHHVSVLRRTS